MMKSGLRTYRTNRPVKSDESGNMRSPWPSVTMHHKRPASALFNKLGRKKPPVVLTGGHCNYLLNFAFKALVSTPFDRSI